MSLDGFSFNNYSAPAPVALTAESLRRSTEAMKAFSLSLHNEKLTLVLSKIQKKLVADLFASDRTFSVAEEG